MLKTEFNNEKYKWFCNECHPDNFWFSNLRFEDLCPHCESEHIYEVEITEEDLTKYKTLQQELIALELRKAELIPLVSNLSWVK